MHRKRSQHSRRYALAPAILRRRLENRAPGRTSPLRQFRLQFEQLEPRLALAGVVINEFLALNTTGDYRDLDNDRSDWIELRNTDTVPVNITGWYLADSADQWQFPALTLAPNQHLRVWASGKNRTTDIQQLHTNFQLSGDGESLKLLMPDGVTVVHAFDPYPAQVDDVSYGLGTGLTSVEPLVDETEPVRALVPTNGDLGTTWTATAFDDAGWLSGVTGVGYERAPGSDPDYTSYFDLDVNLLMPSLEARDTIYMRVPFSVFDVNALQNLELLMRYDDAFVAYLNGQEVARRNFTGSPAWDSSATAAHSDTAAVVYESIDITNHLDKLVAGDNVLAIHGLNQAENRGDFLISPMLLAERAGEAQAGYMVTPSPGAFNQQGTLGLVADTKFSVDRGFYTAPITVQITSATPGATIRYTTDGSPPTATTGLVYDPANPPVFSETTTLRAAAYKTGYTPSNIDTQTYIFLEDVIHQNGVGLPPYAPWGKNLANPVPDWEVDPNIVNHPTYSGTIKNDLQAVSTVSLVLPWNDWFGAGGQGIYIQGTSIERTGSFELFNASGSEDYESVAIMEIQGGGAGGTSADRWKADKLSIQVKFKQPGPTKLNAPLFTNPMLDEGAATSFDTFVLDAVLNYSWHHRDSAEQRNNAKFIQDQVVADFHNLMGGQSPHGRHVHLYLNGLYWGMYYLHERPDDTFAESYLGGNKDDYDVIKHTPTTPVNDVDLNPSQPGHQSSATANYAAMLNLVRQNMTVPANYTAVQQKLDIDNFIDYMLANYYSGNTDWAHKNWYASFNRVDPTGKWRFHSWDAEHVFKSVFEDVTTRNDPGGPTEIHHRLIVNPEYKLRFNDRVQEHFFNGGVLTPQVAGSIYAARMQMVDRAIVGESARWGDNRREPAYTRADWLNTQNNLINNYFPTRSQNVRNQFNTRGWLVTVAAPLFSQYGGTVGEGFQLTLTKPAGSPAGGEIYYTLDGSDPRDATTKMPSASAILYTGPITLDDGAEISARIFVSTNPGTDNDWSAIVDATFFPEIPFPVRITEVHYNPAPRAGVTDKQDMEFIELFNTSNQPVSLAGAQITQFASEPYTFAAGTTLDAGQRLIVARTPAVFQSVYGNAINVALVGYGDANLSNGGERIVLVGPLGDTIQDFVYNNAAPWPSGPDGNGPSLEIVDPLGNPNNPANWRASTLAGGSPGAATASIVGDYDGNAVVNDADRMTWRASFGLAVPTGTGADGNGDGMIDTADFVVWRKAFAASGMAAAVGVSAAVVAAPPPVEESVGVDPTVPAVPLPIVDDQPLARSAPRTLFVAVTPSSSTIASDLLLVELEGAAVDEVLGSAAVLPGWQNAEAALDAALTSPATASLEDSLTIWDDDAWLASLATLA
jgi:hypothetical protein